MKNRKLQIPLRLLSLLAVSVLILSLLPLLLLGAYDTPAADDYIYGLEVHRAVQSGAGPRGVLQAAFQTVADSYRTWQGTFSAVFLMALQPAGFGEQFYGLVPLMMLCALSAGVFALCHAIFVTVLGFSRSFSAILSSLICILCVQISPSPSAAFFWYNSALHYTFFHSLLMLAAALAVTVTSRPAGKSSARLILLSFLCVLLGGSNYTCALTCAILSVSGIMMLVFLRDSSWKRFLFPVILFFIAFAVNIAAPGNAGRQNSITGAITYEPNAFHSVLSSFKWGFLDSIHWLRLPVVGTLVFVYPLIWHALPDRPFRLPGLVTLYSYCLLSSMYCPSYYAMDGIAERTVNVIFFSYLFLLFVNLVWWTGWIRHRLRQRGRSKPSHVDPDGSTPGAVPFWQLGASLLILALCCLFFIRSGTVTSALALFDLRSGEAAGYYETYQQRLTSLHDPSILDVRFDYSEHYPVLLPGLDTVSDPENWVNRAIANYYGKDSVAMNSADPADAKKPR